MKYLNTLAFSIGLGLFGADIAQADEVIAQVGDDAVGEEFGAGTGMLIGGAAGGPLGALIGAGVGALAGYEVQSASGLEGHAYRVRSSNGEEHVYRSPNEEFVVGQQVNVSGSRPHAVTP